MCSLNELANRRKVYAPSALSFLHRNLSRDNNPICFQCMRSLNFPDYNQYIQLICASSITACKTYNLQFVQI